MAIPKKPFEEYTNLREGKICPRGHVGPDGKNVKNKSTGHCLACFCKLPDGPFTHQFENVELKKPYKKKYATEEESKAARSRASARWNAKNKEKFKEYQDKYRNKEERIVSESIKRKAWWANLPPEEKQAKMERMRASDKKREEKLKETPGAYEAMIEARRLRCREGYYRRKAEKLLKEQDEHSRT